MDESRRDQINQRIQEARRLASFSIPVDLANETEWLLADLADKESTIAQILAEAERARDSARIEREKLTELVASQAKRIAHLETDVSREKAFGDKHFKKCEAQRAENVDLGKRIADLEKFRITVAAVTPFQSDDNIERHAADIVSNIEGRTYRKELTEKTLPELRKRIAELESSIAHASSQLPTVDNIREAWYSYDGTGIEAAAGVARMLQNRFAPLLAVKDADVSRLQLALETKTREWMAATTNGDNLKEQLRRLTSDLGAAESRAIKAERSVKLRLPSVSEMHEWFLDGYGGAKMEVSPGQDAAEANGIQYLRGKLALMFGEDNEIVDVNAGYDLAKKQREAWSERLASRSCVEKSIAAPSLRQRFIAATKDDSCEVSAYRQIFFHDLLRLCEAIDATPCSSAEALTRVCATFAGVSLKLNPQTRTLAQQEWSAIGRELKNHLGYEPMVYSDRIELRDGRVWYDYDYQKLTFTMH